MKGQSQGYILTLKLFKWMQRNWTKQTKHFSIDDTKFKGILNVEEFQEQTWRRE